MLINIVVYKEISMPSTLIVSYMYIESRNWRGTIKPQVRKTQT